MSSFERKLKRKNEKKAKKLAEQELATKVALFGKLPDKCLTCDTTFDKMNREQVMSWNVVVKEELVRLYCPECWDKATKIIKDFKEHLKEKNER
jgi:Zn finger protein HypA/HybF involved in hydrogenase expression